MIIGEALAGRAGDAWEHYRKICPAYISDQDLHKVEPYVYCQMVAGKDAARPGEGKNSWLTGTAAWNWYAVTQFLLGIRPDYDGLTIKPCMPAQFDAYEVDRTFRKARYRISLRRTGKPGIVLDGKPVEGSTIPYSPGEHEVKVTF